MRQDVHINIFTRLIGNVWPKFRHHFPQYDRPHYNKMIEAVLRCANPIFGFRQYMCLHCGKDDKLVAFSCKSKFCLRCGRMNGEQFAEAIKSRLHPDVTYRHLIYTIPQQFRRIFYDFRFDGLAFRGFYQVGWECTQAFISQAFGHEVECGCVMVLHTVGRSGEYKPHLHVLLMGGGVNKETKKWEVLEYFPYEIMRNCWKKALLKMVRELDAEGKYKSVIDHVDANYQNGFVVNIKAGVLPKDGKHLIRYIAKYLCRPQISIKRIKNYDADSGEVEFNYKSHKTKKMETEKLSELNFMGRLVQQILPKGFQRVRYFGLQSTKHSERLKYIVSKAVGSFYFPEHPVETNIDDATEKKLARKLWYQELVMRLWNGKDPLQCSFCGEQMELVRVWEPKKGVVFDLFRNIFGCDIGPPGCLPIEIINRLQKI